MPPSALHCQTAWEHLQAHTLDHTHHPGRLYTQDELESYLSPDQGVKWQRDHIHIKITFDDNTSETFNTNNLYKAWASLIKAIPTTINQFLRQPEPSLQNLNTKTLAPSPFYSPNEKQWYITHRNKWYKANKMPNRKLLKTSEQTSPPPDDPSPPAMWRREDMRELYAAAPCSLLQ
jgi:hypothetical protein